MTPEQQTEKRNLMESTWTKAAIVRRKFKAGPSRRKDIVHTPTRAVLEAWILCHELQTAMKTEGLSEEDAQAVLVLLDGTDATYSFAVPAMDSLPELYGKVKALQEAGTVVPVGVLFKQFDREAEDRKTKSGAVVWAHPWLVGLRESRALLNARDRYANLKPGENLSN
jgi:hypothetical protein